MRENSGTPTRPRPLRRALIAVLGTLALAATAATAATLPANASAPPPPTGWSQVFVDDFTGAAGSGVNTANWQYTTGTSYPGGPANFGTGEIETMTSSTNNVSLDGSGNLRITRCATAQATGPRAASRRYAPTSSPRPAANSASSPASRCRT